MATATTAPALSYTRLEDLLANLPVSVTSEYGKGQTIYNPDHPSTDIYLVVSGKVEIFADLRQG